ncbi:GNAT family N-acetyltransferase [Enterovibrio norvegicus]|uniref:GNAT family N-acetyltransferase n=1 Tax=Enterovibrio norvegicus TaxID=188144 RepID=UPI000C82BBAF|nr:GNAT family N-acetyltransferase [Enterovibrio norvegicus]PMN62822.1 GNAT family N-acetyltransferase [Enterovibrio norvegicus]
MDNLTISSLLPEDKSAVFDFLQDSVVMRFLGPRRPLTDEEASAWFELELNAATRHVFRTKGTNDLVGFCGIKVIDGVQDFAYFLLKAHWGKGFAADMCRMAVEKLPDTTDLGKVQVFIANDNTASRAVARKLGWLCVCESDNQYEKGHLYRIKR